MATNTVYVKLGLQGAEEIQKALNGLGAAGEAAFAKIRAAADKSSPGSGSKLDAGLNKIKASYETITKAGGAFGKSIDYASTSFSKFNSNLASTSLKLGALKLAFDTVAGAVFLLGKNAIDTVDELDRQSQALGLSIEKYTSLVSAAEASSIEQDKFAASLQKVNTFLENQTDAATETANALAKQIREIQNNGSSTEKQQAAISKAMQNAREAAGEEVTALNKLGVSLRELSEATPDERIYLLADAFQRMGSTAERNAVGVELFGKGALKMIAFLGQGSAEIKKQEAEFRRLGFSVTDAQKQIASLGDNALDKLSLALKGARLQIGLLFAPAITRGANALTEWFADNLESIKAWGRQAADTVEQFVSDVINAFKGLDGKVTNQWVLTIRDVLVSLPVVAKQVIDLITAAFDLFATALAPVATAINGIFGTQFTGRSLAIVVLIGKMVGAFRLLGSTIQLLVFVPVNAFIGLLRSIILIAPGVLEGLRGIAAVLGIVGPAITAFIVANPVLLTVVGTVALLAAGITYLYSQQTELERATSEAAIGMDEYDAAARRAADGTRESTNALLEQQEALLNQRRLAVLDARDLVQAAQEQLDGILAAQRGAATIGLGASFEATKELATRELSDAIAVLTAREQALSTAQAYTASTSAKLKEQLKQQADAMPKLAEATNKTADGFVRITIHMGTAGEKIQEVPRELDAAAKKAVESKNKLDAALKDPTPDNDALLAQIRQRADEFVTAMEGIVNRYRNLGTDLAASIGNGFDALPSAMQSAADQAVNIFSTMVNRIEAEIARLRSVLERLRSQISAAASAASKSSSSTYEKRAGGGYIYGAGGPTQDNIPAWLSAGEYVLRNAAVKKLPLSFLNALNSGRYDLGSLMRRFLNMRFADGGMVGLPSISLPSISMAGAGAGGPSSSLTLVLDGQTFAGLTGSTDTIARLERAVQVRKVRATGRQNPYA